MPAPPETENKADSSADSATDSAIVRKYRTLYAVCGLLLTVPAGLTLLFYRNAPTSTLVCIVLFLVVGLFALGRAFWDDGAGLDEREKAQLEALSRTKAPEDFLGHDLATYNEVFKPRLFGGFGLRANVWIANGVLCSHSLLRSKQFPLKDARGFCFFEFHYPRTTRTLYLCDESANSRIKVDVLASDCSSLLRWAQSNLTPVSIEGLR